MSRATSAKVKTAFGVDVLHSIEILVIAGQEGHIKRRRPHAVTGPIPTLGEHGDRRSRHALRLPAWHPLTPPVEHSDRHQMPARRVSSTNCPYRPRSEAP